MPFPMPPKLFLSMLVHAPLRAQAPPESAVFGPKPREVGEERAIRDALSARRRRGTEPDDQLLLRMVNLVADGSGEPRLTNENARQIVSEFGLAISAASDPRLTARCMADGLRRGLELAGVSDRSGPALDLLQALASLSDKLWARIAAADAPGFHEALANSPLAATRTGQAVLRLAAGCPSAIDLPILMAPLIILTPLQILKAFVTQSPDSRRVEILLRLAPERDSRRGYDRPMRRWLEQVRAVAGLDSFRQTTRCLLLPSIDHSWRDPEASNDDALLKRHNRLWSRDRATAVMPSAREFVEAAERASARCPEAAERLRLLGTYHWAVCLFENLALLAIDLQQRLDTHGIPALANLPFAEFREGLSQAAEYDDL